mmetsp:Transcript_1890/g.2560  ORF Transcript_1890/g.2560 Transcript_1890/m.2560 type:complete len:95 (+) Transcript_1890:134-418(+)
MFMEGKEKTSFSSQILISFEGKEKHRSRLRIVTHPSSGREKINHHISSLWLKRSLESESLGKLWRKTISSIKSALIRIVRQAIKARSVRYPLWE